MPAPLPAEDAATDDRYRADALFRTRGMHNPLPGIRTLDGVNKGWIDFPEEDREVLKGTTSVAEVVAALVRVIPSAVPTKAAPKAFRGPA